MNMQNIPYWGQLLIVLGLCVVGGFLFYQFYLQNELNKITGLERNLDKLNKEVAELRRHERNRDELLRRIRQTEEKLAGLKEIFPSEKIDQTVQQFLIDAARENKVEIVDIQWASAIQEQSYEENVLEVRDSRAGTLDFMKFFFHLMKRGQVYHVYDLQLRRAPQRRSARTSQALPVQAVFKLSYYVVKEIPIESGADSGGGE